MPEAKFSSPRRLAVVKRRALGDTIISLGAIQYLREILPATKIIYFVPQWTEPLFRDVSIAADRVVGFKMDSPRDWWDTVKLLDRENVDCIFEMSQTGRTAKLFKAYSLWRQVKYIAHNHHKTTGPVIDQGTQKPIIQRDLDGAWSFFGKPQGLEVPEFLNYTPSMGLYPLSRKNKVILGVVATRETKMYPLEKYAALAKLIHAQDPETEVVAPLSKSPTDLKIKERFVQLGGDVQTVSLPLNDLPAFFKEARVYIGNDTGLKHLAVAMDTPTVTLFGPEPPMEWHPYETGRHPYFYQDKLVCRTTTGTTYCPLNTCDSMVCLKSFRPEDIWTQASKLMSPI